MATSAPLPHGRQPRLSWRVALNAAAPVWLAGWLVLRFGGRRNPGVGWTIGHLVWTVSFLLFAAGSVALFRMVSGRRRHLATAAVPLAVTGAAAFLGQMAVNLAAGWRAADRAELVDLVRRLTEPPGIRPLLYDLAPVLSLAGLVILIVLAVGQREGGAGGIVLAMIGVVLAAVGRNATGGWRVFEGLGVLFLWLAVLPLMPEVEPAGTDSPNADSVHEQMPAGGRR